MRFEVVLDARIVARLRSQAASYGVTAEALAAEGLRASVGVATSGEGSDH